MKFFNSNLKFSRSFLIADCNTVVETSAIEELLLNFGLELKKLRDEFY